MNKTTIAVGTREDIPDLMRLVKELALYERAPNEVTNTEERMLEDGFGPNPCFGFYTAKLEGVLVGIALFYTRYSTWKGRCLYLEDIVVTEAYRGKGIGHLLFLKCVEHARENNFAMLNWQVLDWNEPAINFYKKYHAHFDGEWVNCKLFPADYEKVLASTSIN